MKSTYLEATLAIVRSMDGVAEASIYTPDADTAAELLADGIEPRSTLEVTIWKSHRNASWVAGDIEALGLERIGEGSSILGPCYSFAIRA